MALADLPISDLCSFLMSAISSLVLDLHISDIVAYDVCRRCLLVFVRLFAFYLPGIIKTKNHDIGVLAVSICVSQRVAQRYQSNLASAVRASSNSLRALVLL